MSVTDAHPTDSLLWLIFKDFVLDITDPAGKLLATSIPDAWKQKLEQWMRMNPQYAPHIVPVLKRGTRVIAQRLVNVSRLFRGVLPDDSVEALEHIFDDALNHILRSAEKHMNDPSAAGAAAGAAGAVTGEGLPIIEEDGVSVIHSRRSCPRFQRAFGQKIKVLAKDAGDQNNQGGKKGQQKQRFEERDPVVTTASPEEAAKLLEMSGFKTCRICESGKVIHGVHGTGKTESKGNTLRERFFQLGEQVTQALSHDEGEAFDEEVSAFLGVHGSFTWIERYVEFNGNLTVYDMRLLFCVPAHPKMEELDGTASADKRKSVMRDYQAQMNAWQKAVEAVRLRRNTLLTEADKTLAQRKADKEAKDKEEKLKHDEETRKDLERSHTDAIQSGINLGLTRAEAEDAVGPLSNYLPHH